MTSWEPDSQGFHPKPLLCPLLCTLKELVYLLSWWARFSFHSHPNSLSVYPVLFKLHISFPYPLPLNQLCPIQSNYSLIQDLSKNYSPTKKEQNSLYLLFPFKSQDRLRGMLHPHKRLLRTILTPPPGSVQLRWKAWCRWHSRALSPCSWKNYNPSLIMNIPSVSYNLFPFLHHFNPPAHNLNGNRCNEPVILFNKLFWETFLSSYWISVPITKYWKHNRHSNNHNQAMHQTHFQSLYLHWSIWKCLLWMGSFPSLSSLISPP